MAEKPVAVSYVRWSNPLQASGDSLRRQTALSEAYAQQHGLRMLPVSYLDAGRSAYRGANLRAGGALAALITAVEDKTIPRDAWILCESLDRISRSDVLTALDAFRRILKLGCTLVTLQDSQRYTWESVKDNFGQLIVSLSIMARAHEESRMKASRLAAAWSGKRQRAADSKTPLTGRTPAWIRLDPTTRKYDVIPAHAQTVRLIFQWTADGQGKTAVTRRLHRERVKPIGRVASWHPSYVEKLLQSRAVLGEFQPHRLVVDPETGARRRVPEGDAIPGMFPQIVSPALFLKVQRGRQQRRIPAGRRGEKVSNLFTGLLRCECGSAIYLTNKGRAKDGSLAKYLDCADRRRGVLVKKRRPCRLDSWPYAKTERLVLTLCQRIIPWTKLVPQTRSAAQEQLAALVEQDAELQDERVTLDAKVAKVVQAIEQVGISAALTARLTALEAQAASLRLTAEDVRGRVVEAKTTLANARETVQRQREVFDAYKAGKLADEESRTRLSRVLRELLKRIELRHDRRLGIVLVSGEDADFVCAPDLSAVYDTEGEHIVTLDETVR